MKIIKKEILKILKFKWFRIALFAGIFLFTFIIRAHNYERVPTSNHMDEQLYAWSGINMIEVGVPISWSTLDYPKSAIVYLGRMSYKGGPPEASVTLYKPWLDEPPLFSYIVGYFAHINGADRNGFIPSSYIRIPTVIFATIVSVFVFLIAYDLGGYYMGLLAMLIYGTTPIFVFGSRTAMPENLIALCFIFIYWLLIKYRDNPKFKILIPIPIIVGIAGLSKPTGYFLILFAVLVTILLSLKKIPTGKIFKRVVYLIIGIIPFITWYFWYSYNLSPEIFKTIFSIQAGRPVGFSSFAWFLISPAVDTVIFKDGWYLFSLLAAIYLILKKNKDTKLNILSIAFIFWVLVVMFTGGEADLLAWYRFPLFPILAIISAWGMRELLKLNNIFTTFIFFGLLLTGRYLSATPFYPNVKPLVYKCWLALTITPGLLSLVFKKKIFVNLNKAVMVIIVLAGIVWNSTLIYRYFGLVCEGIVCPMVPSTTLSSIGFPEVWKLLPLAR